MNSIKNKKYILFAIVVMGFCLRPSITSLGSLMKLMKPQLGLSDTASGFLTTIPLITFALFSPFVGKIKDEFGTSRTLFSGFGLIACGILVRSFGEMVGLYAGTVMIGLGIAYGNVLIPAIIKSEFPEKYGLVTALNSVGLALSSAIASGINYPLAATVGLGWNKTFCIYALLACLAIVIWFPIRKRVNIPSGKRYSFSSLLKNKVAWSVTLFLGIEALIFYSCSAWLSVILQAKGLDAATAGYYVSCFQLTRIPASFIIPFLAGRKKDQRTVTAGLLVIFMAGIGCIALTAEPAHLLGGALLAGFGCNGGFALSMAFIGFRSSNGEDAMRLSVMSQSVGYVIAAFGPIGMGMVHDVLGDWNLNLWLVECLLILLLLVSLRCAKEGTISDEDMRKPAA